MRENWQNCKDSWHIRKKAAAITTGRKKETALCYEKITNSRKDYLHKISHEIVSENQVIVSENLQIKNMVKNRHLAKSISDVSWYGLTRQLEYKAEWNQRKYVRIDRFYGYAQPVVIKMQIQKICQ